MASRYLRISITESCNLRCRFCHNESQGPVQRGRGAEVPTDQLRWLVAVAQTEGFRKFKLTGGEPTVRRDLLFLIRELRDVGADDLSMITNGVLLSRLAVGLRKAGLPRLNVSLPTLSAGRFQSEIGGTAPQLRSVVAGIDAALAAGFTDMKLNYVMQAQPAGPVVRIGRPGLAPTPPEELLEVLAFARARSLVVVLLPMLVEYSSDDHVSHTLRELYEMIVAMGISGEEELMDDEGIHKRLITLRDGTRVLLRADELWARAPFSDCANCERKGQCREGIFPIRVSSRGALIPCLAEGRPGIDIAGVLKRRDDAALRVALKHALGTAA